jgi:hypothetical protein
MRDQSLFMPTKCFNISQLVPFTLEPTFFMFREKRTHDTVSKQRIKRIWKLNMRVCNRFARTTWYRLKTWGSSYALSFYSLFIRTQYVDRVANVVVGGDRAVTCRRANQVALGYVPGVVMFCLAAMGGALAVPTARQRSETTQVSVMNLGPTRILKV